MRHFLPPGVERHVGDHTGTLLLLDQVETDDVAPLVDAGGDDVDVPGCDQPVPLRRVVCADE